MTAKHILDCLSIKFEKDALYLRNTYVFNGEADFLAIDYKDKTHEFEVKISRSDFKADFKKPKHKFFLAITSKQEYVTLKGREHNATCDITHILRTYEAWKTRNEYLPKPRPKPNPVLRNIQQWYCDVAFVKVNPNNIPNQFSFVVPDGLIKKEEVPDYAGLSYVMPDGKIKSVKHAKRFHSKPFTRWKTIASKMYWKLRNEQII